MTSCAALQAAGVPSGRIRTVTDVLPAPWNARTRVHEYGGGAWTVADGTLWFTEFADQRLYRLDPGSGDPVAVTPEPAVPSGVRYADLHVTPSGVLAVSNARAAGELQTSASRSSGQFSGS